MSKAKKYASILSILILVVWANNSSLFPPKSPKDSRLKLIAHRGVHQTYAGDNRTSNTCRAGAIAPIQHRFIENTIPSMQAAFDYGADVVELDVHLTTDSILAVYHDWELECQTNGEGVTKKQSFEYLSKLDLGFGFTEDGRSFPLRGAGIGLMPTLNMVFEAKLPGLLLVNFKSNDETEGYRLAEEIENNQYPYRDQLFGVYGGEPPTEAAIRSIADVRGFGRASLKACVKTYALIGWTGIVPTNCKNRIIAIPINFAPYLWGWPHKFTSRMKAVNTEVILWGPYDGTRFSSGVDDRETLERVPAGFSGYVWTNKIEIIGPLVRK